MKDDYNRISSRALEEKRNDALDNWFIKKIPTYYIMVDDQFKDCPEMSKWLTPAAKN
jgi:peptidyl-prolyl cis-trans isomerase SurA